MEVGSIVNSITTADVVRRSDADQILPPASTRRESGSSNGGRWQSPAAR
jgi:hypothetical protein